MTTSLTYWNPAFRRNHIDKIFNSAFNDFLGSFEAPETTQASKWSPALDIRETEDAVTLFAELPGLTKEDVDISLEDNTLTLRGERHFEQLEGENYHRIERAFGQFTRTFTLPTHIDSKEISAEFEHGILTIHLPKAAEAKARKIAIK